jgi:hypothetical protein
MEDVLDVYSRPYDPDYPVVCMDETSKQLVEETRKPLPLRPGHPQSYDYEYERHGVSNLFICCEPLQGRRHIKVTEHRTKLDWAYFMRDVVDVFYPDAVCIRLVLDNLNTHRPSSFYEAFEPTEAKRILERIEFHYTPKHGSWLNIAEIELSVLSRQCLDQRIPNKESLEQQVAAWEAPRNTIGSKVDWRFTTVDDRIKLKRLYPSIST